VACVRVRRNAYRALGEKLNVGDQLDNIFIDGWTMLKWILKGIGWMYVG
jgi:hypothetical protein